MLAPDFIPLHPGIFVGFVLMVIVIQKGWWKP